MLVGSCLLIIIILSFGSPLIPAAPNPSHNAVKLKIFQIGCGHPQDRQDISIGTFYPIHYLPGSKDSLPCTPLTPAGVSCNMTRLHSDPHIIAVELRAKDCTGSTPHSRVFAGKPINETDTNETHTDKTYATRADIHVIPTRLPEPFAADHYYIEVKMHVDSTFTLVQGTLFTKGTHVLPPSTGNAADFASAILPSAALANCAKGFIFGTAKILDRKTPIPTDCIDAHTGVQSFANHVVIGAGYSDYMTDKDVQELPAPESRALVAAARNNVIFTNNMYNALTQAYTEAQLLVSDMKNNLLPAFRPPSISVKLGDALIFIGIFLPLLSVGGWGPFMAAAGGSILFAGTLMNEQPESPETVFDIVSDDRLQRMQDSTQESFLKLMHTVFYSDQNYTAFNHFYNGSAQDFAHMKARIKQHAVGWSASKILNYYGLKICDNPDDFDNPQSQWPMYENALCNDKIQNTTADCRLGGGYENDGYGYSYVLSNGSCLTDEAWDYRHHPKPDSGTPSGNIVNFQVYLPNGSYDDLCNSQNGWNITRDKCHWYDFPSMHERSDL